MNSVRHGGVGREREAAFNVSRLSVLDGRGRCPYNQKSDYVASMENGGLNQTERDLLEHLK